MIKPADMPGMPYCIAGITERDYLVYLIAVSANTDISQPVCQIGGKLATKAVLGS